MGLTRHATSPVWQRPFDLHRVTRKIRLPSNRDNRRSSHEHQRIHRLPARCRARRPVPLVGSAALDDARRASVETCTPPRRSAESGCRSVLGGPSIVFEPSERLLPIVALSATAGKRVPPLTPFLRAPRAETLRSAPNAVRRPPRQGRPPRSTLRAPSIVRVERRAAFAVFRSRCRSRGFAASIRPPTLFRRSLPEKRWLDGRYRGLITRGRSRRASLDDFCNPCDPQARFPRDRRIPCFRRPRPKSRAGKSRCAHLAARRSRDPSDEGAR